MNYHKGNMPVSLKNVLLRFFSESTDALRSKANPNASPSFFSWNTAPIFFTNFSVTPSNI